MFFARKASEEAALRKQADDAKAAGDTASADQLSSEADKLRDT